MKNIQVIDGADNCTFPIFQTTEDEFRATFPVPGQDIEFAEDLFDRLGEPRGIEVMSPIWKRPIRKSEANGIHGTLFYGFADRKKYFPKTKREKDWSPVSLNEAQRQLYARPS